MNPDQDEYKANTEVVVEAVPGKNYKFEKWTESLAESNELKKKITVQGNIYLGAHFKEKEPKIGDKLWNYSLNKPIFSNPAISSEGTIYVGSNDNYLYALDENGYREWKFETGYHVMSPVIGEEGTIYVGSEDGFFYAVDPNGWEKWKIKKDINSAPVIGKDGTIYVRTDNSYLAALSPENGEEQWKIEADGYFVYSSRPAVSETGVIYTKGAQGYLYAFESNGTEKWCFNKEVGYPIIAEDGTIYAIGNDKLFAIKPDGTEKWSFTFGDDIVPGLAIGKDNEVYVRTKERKLYALKEDGTVKWTFSLPTYPHLTPSVGADGTVYIGSDDHKLYALNPDGTKKWEYRTSFWITTSAAIGDDGTVYVGTRDGYFYAIKGESGGLADTAWPTFGGNNRNDGRPK